MSKSVMLVDGYSLIFRGFHALPILTASDGTYTNAVVGFFNMLFKALSDYRPDALCVMLDMSAPTFRHTLYEAYKGTRKPTPEELRPQFGLVRELLQKMDIHTCELQGYEADDLLGTAAAMANRQGMEAYILTGDRDSLQLVNAHTRVVLTRKGISESLLLDEKGVLQEYGFTPAQVPDMKGLMGDSSDNIPGIAGIGEKTALKLIQEYGSLDQVLAHAGEIKGKLGEKIQAGRDNAILSRDLGTIRTGAPLELDFSDCGWDHMEQAIPDLEKLELRVVIKNLKALFGKDESSAAQPAYEVKSTAAARRAGQKNTRSETVFAVESREVFPKYPAVSDTLVFDDEELLKKAAEQLASEAPPWVAMYGNDAEITLFLPDGVLWRIPLSQDRTCRGLTEEYAYRSLCPLFEKVPFIVHGAKALWHELEKYSIKPFTVIRDTLISSYLLFTAQKDRSLPGALLADYGEDLATRKDTPAAIDSVKTALKMANEAAPSNCYLPCAEPLWSLDGGGFAGQRTESAAPAQAPESGVQAGDSGQLSWFFMPQAAEQAETVRPDPAAPADDERENAADLAALCVRHEIRLLRRGLLPLLVDLELPLTGTLFRMEKTGFKADRKVLDELGEIFSADAEKSRLEFFELSGLPEFNLNSPKQLSEALFDKLGLPAPSKKGKTGYTTSAETLEELSPYHPCIDAILRYRKMTKLQSTYIDGLKRLTGKEDRIHTTFDQTAAVTGRISSLEPNLQNIPIRSEEGREIRRAFVAREGCVLVDADYSQIELRVLAHLSGDETMLQTFRSGEDIHARTAAEIAGVSIEDVTPQMRRSAKAVNFGIVYGISGFGLSRNAKISLRDAKQYIETYFERYPGVKAYMQNCVETGKATGCASTLFGRKRELTELASSNRNVRNFGERAAMNTPVQGTAADLIKKAMIEIEAEMQKAGLQARLILQVHDELIVECPAEETEQVSALLKSVMEHTVSLDVPLVAEVSVGKSWDEAH